MGRKNYEYANKSGNCADVTHSTKAKVVGLPINYILHIRIVAGFKSCIFLDVDQLIVKIILVHNTDMGPILTEVCFYDRGWGEVCMYVHVSLDVV